MTATMEDPSKQIDEAAERVDKALARVREENEPARARALELKTAIEEFHKEGLIRIVRHLRADPRGKELLLELAADPAVYTLLAMHGIVRSDTSSGSEAPPETKPAAKPAASTGFVPLGELLKAPGWTMGPALAELVDGKPFRLDLGERSVLLLSMNGVLTAFRNECAHQGLPLDGGMVDRDACTITCPWHGFRYDASTGACLTAPQAQLERLDTKVEGGRIQVRTR